MNEIFSCDQCNKSFKAKQKMNYHVKNKVCVPKHICWYCNKSYKTIGGLERHINKLHDNESKQSSKSIPKVSQKYPKSIPKVSQKYPKVSQNILNTFQNISTNSPDQTICEYCNKKFKHKNNVYRHKKKSCKVKKEKEAEVETEMQAYKDMLLMLKEQLEKQNEKINKIENENKKLKQQITITDNSIVTNNSISHNTNNTQNINNYFSINSYGNENLKHLETKDYLKCFNSGVDCLIEYVRLKHFDPEHPENHNLYLPNIQQPFYKIYDGEKFILQSIDKLINEVIDTNLIELDDKYDEIKKKLFNRAIERYGKFIAQYDGKEREGILDYLTKELKILMYNERDKPVKTEKKSICV